MTYTRCRAGCGSWLEKHEKACPKCGTGRWPSRASAAQSQAWRSNLNFQAEHAVKHT